LFRMNCAYFTIRKSTSKRNFIKDTWNFTNFRAYVFQLFLDNLIIITEKTEAGLKA